MMKKNELKPNFKMSYSALMQLGDKAVMLINRDAAELETYGVNEALKNLIQQKTQELKDIPTDEELLADVSFNTEEKNKHADAIRNSIRTIMVRAKNVFGDQSSQYKHFGVKSLERMTDDDLYRCSKRVSRTATMYLSELSAKGLTEGEITNLSSITQTLDDKIDAKDDAVRNRDIATESRVDLSNELYKLISELFDYGKDYWSTRKESKYNDYIVYDHPSNGKKADNIAPAMETTIASDENITAETVFEIENTGKVSIIFYVSESSEAEIPENALSLAPKESQIIKADKISDGTYGLLLVLNASNADGTFLLARVE